MGASNICGTTPNLRPYSIQTRPCLEEPPCESKLPCYLRYMLFPNPASSVVNINIDPTSNNINHEELFSLKVYNSLGILLYESTENENQVASSFSVATWSDGLYTVLIQTDRGTQALKLAIQKGSVAN